MWHSYLSVKIEKWWWHLQLLGRDAKINHLLPNVSHKDHEKIGSVPTMRNFSLGSSLCQNNHIFKPSKTSLHLGYLYVGHSRMRRQSRSWPIDEAIVTLWYYDCWLWLVWVIFASASIGCVMLGGTVVFCRFLIRCPTKGLSLARFYFCCSSIIFSILQQTDAW